MSLVSSWIERRILRAGILGERCGFGGRASQPNLLARNAWPAACSLKSFGIDPLWFAVVLLMMLRTAYLTPPMAPSIFYLKAIAPPTMKLKHMYWGVIPFICCQILVLALLIAFPGLATWMPKVMYGN